jgi:glucokinase
MLAEAHRATHITAEPDATLAQACDAIHETIAGVDSSLSHPVGLGVAAPGQLLTEEGICLSCSEFPSWRDVHLTAAFSEEFGLPTCLLGTTQAAAVAEACFGAARGLSTLLFVRVGGQIDFALVVNGQPISLPRVLPGQAGHMVIEAGGSPCSCGELGCWQALSSRDALVARVLRAIRKGSPSAVAAAAENRLDATSPALIVQMAANGDAVARRALEETGRYLGIGLANLITLFSPEAVVVDGVPASLGPLLLQAAEATLKSSPRASLLSHCVLLSSELGGLGEVLGAASAARAVV